MRKRVAFLTAGILILLILTFLPWAARLGPNDNGGERLVNYYIGVTLNGNIFMPLSGLLTALALIIAALHLSCVLRGRPIFCGILLIASTVCTLCCLFWGATELFAPLTVIITVGQALAAVFALLGCR